MPAKHLWTEAMDLRLKRRRAEGDTWQRISEEFGVSRDVAIERGRRIGARRPPPEICPLPDEIDRDPARPPLQAGHPRSWNFLTAGTVLEGQPFNAAPSEQPLITLPLVVKEAE